MFGGPISWKSKRQATVALSTVEAEYMGLSMCLQECLWLLNLSEEIGLKFKSLTVFQDNQGSIKLAKNPVSHQRTKRIDIRHHFVREKVAQGIIDLEYCPGNELIADILTKPLPRPQFTYLREKLKIVEIDNGTQGELLRLDLEGQD